MKRDSVNAIARVRMRIAAEFMKTFVKFSRRHGVNWPLV